MKNICVFLGSNFGATPIFREATVELGCELARRNLTLVYGGSNMGLMGILADTVLAAGGRAVGVIPTTLVEKEVAHRSLTEQIIAVDMHERKARMMELADAFIALPGGLGTMEEFFEVLCWAQIGLHEKPCGLLDVGGYYTELNAFLDKVVHMGFVKAVHRDLALMDNTPAGLLDQFDRFVPPRVSKWIDKD